MERSSVYHQSQETIERSHLHEMIRAEVIRDLHRVMETLPGQCQKVIRLSYLEGLNNAEIAQQLSLSVQTVKNHKLRGLAILRKSLKPDQLTFLMSVPALHLMLRYFS